VREGLEITPVGHVDEVLNIALHPEAKEERPKLVIKAKS
jgi:hypothetical protein